MNNIKIAGVGSYLPARKVHNNELAQILDTSDEWIFTHTGISSRYLAADTDSATSMGVAAAEIALKSAGVAPEELGMVLLSSTTLDYGPYPSTGCLIQAKIGAKNSVAFDISAACCGFVFGLQLAKGFMQLDPRPCLVIGSELMSRKIDWNDRTTCVLFGDAAGAAVLKVHDDPKRGVIDTFMQSDGTGADSLKQEGGCRLPPPTGPTAPHYLQMDGKAIFTFAVKMIPNIIKILAERNNLELDEIDWFLPHQANYRIINSAAKRLGVTLDRFYVNISEVANTASASIPMALHQMECKGLLKPGDKILTAGFGAGLTFGGNYIVW